MSDLELGNFKIVVQTGKTTTLRWLGVSDIAIVSSEIDVFLDQCIDSFDGELFVLDFQGLEYMHSSSVPVIVELLKKLNTAEITTQLVWEKTIFWQETTFRALRRIGETLEHITITG